MGLFEAFDKVSHQDWIDKINEDLKGKDFQETLVWNTEEGIDVQPFYNNNSGSPSSTPLKKSSDWKIRETITIQSIEVANQKALLALKGGANSILFFGEIKDQTEMNKLLENIQIDIIDLHFYNSSPKHTSTLIKPNHGSISCDYLGEMISEKYDANIKNRIKDLAEITPSTSNIKTITVNGSNYSNGGYTVIQEVAFSLNQAVEYFNLFTNNGLEAKDLASKIQFTFSIGTNYFFEIAKLRAARKLWKLILKQYSVSDSTMFIHSETSISEVSGEEKNYILLQNTTKAMSAIIGGCDSLTVLPHDNDNTTIDFSNRIARNVQHILKEEAFFDKVKNPTDGAYYIEQLTDEISSIAWKLFQKVEEQGGFISCIENNFIQEELLEVN